MSWASAKEVYRAAGDIVAGKPPKVGRSWMSDASCNLIDRMAIQRNIESVTYNQQKSLLQRYKPKNKAVKKSTRRDKRQHVENLTRSAEEASVNGDLSSVYKITKEVSRALDKDGGLLSSKDEQLRRWKEHFLAVLNRVVSYEATRYA